MQASRSSADAVRQIVQPQMGLILICIWLIGNGVSLEKVDKFCYLGDMWGGMQMEDVIQQ